MKTILVASALGGSGATTTAVRLAEAWLAEGRDVAVGELSAWPSASLITADSRLKVRALPAPVSAAAARSLLKPLAGDVVLLDAARLDDPALLHWVCACDAVLLVTRCDTFSLGAFSRTWPMLEALRAANPAMEFLGFLPTMVRPEEEASLRSLRMGAREHVLGHAIPMDPAESRRSQGACFEGQEPLAPSMDLGSTAAHGACAAELASRLQLPAPKPVAPAAPATTGLFTKLWSAAKRGARLVATPGSASA